MDINKYLKKWRAEEQREVKTRVNQWGDCSPLTSQPQESSWVLTGRRAPTPSGPTHWASLWPATPSLVGSSAMSYTKSCGTVTAM